MTRPLDALLPSTPVAASSGATGAYERLLQIEQRRAVRRDPKARHDAWQKLREERAATRAEVKNAVLAALIARGGRSAAEALSLDVHAGSYAFDAAVRELGQERLIERPPGSRGEWRLTDWSRERLTAAGHTLGPELNTAERRAADLAELVLDGLRGEGGGVPSPVLSMHFLRAHTGCSWGALSTVLDALEAQHKIERVFSGARIRGVRLTIPDTREAVTATATEIAPLLAEPSTGDTAPRIARLSIDLLEYMVRRDAPISKGEMKEVLHVGPVVLRRILAALVAEEMISERFIGAQSAGWAITNTGRVRVDAPIRPVVKEEPLSPGGTLKELLRHLEAQSPPPPRSVAVDAWAAQCQAADESGRDWATPEEIERGWRRHGGVLYERADHPEMFRPEPPVTEPLEDRVLLALAAAHPQPLTRDALQAQLGGSAVALRAAIDAVVAAGGATRVMNGGRSLGWVATEAALELARGCGAPATSPG